MRNTIYVRDPFAREFDTLVRRAFGPSEVEPGRRQAGFSPAAETRRDGQDLVVRLELPGVDAGRDVDVEVRGRHLVVSGQRRDERDESTEHGRVREFRYGGFRRAFDLGRQVDAERVAASYDAGVLSVRVTGAYAETPRHKVEISTGTPSAIGSTVPAPEAAEDTPASPATEQDESPEA